MNFYDEPLNNNNIYFTRKCIECDKFYGIKKNGFKCTKCANIKIISSKILSNKSILDSYKEVNNNQFIKIKNVVKNLDYIKNEEKLKNIYKNHCLYQNFIKEHDSKFNYHDFIEQREDTNLKFSETKFKSFIISFFYLFIVFNFDTNDILDENLDKILVVYYSLKKNKQITLLSNDQAYELIILTKWKKYYINEGLELSHTIAKLMKYPWKQNENFHPASSCYHGNYREVPNLKYNNIIKNNIQML
jgi:hypothetical protein